MKFIVISLIALLGACAGSQRPASSQRTESTNCGVLVYTSAAGAAARGLERICTERSVRIVR